MGEFKLGITLSGGATMGCYTAGVMDFILEALSELHIAQTKRSNDENEGETSAQPLPPWSVKLCTMAGTSAGSIVTFLTAAGMCLPHEPIPHDFKYGDNPPKNNLLYQGWVVDLERGLWDNDDLPPAEETGDGLTIYPVKSLLNANYFPRLANHLLENHSDTSRAVPKWAKGLRLIFSLGNCRGIPYTFEFGGSLDPAAHQYRMLRHRDHMSFDTDNESVDGGSKYLDLRSRDTSSAWNAVITAASSSASVPLVFASQIIERPVAHYSAANALRIERNPDWPNDMPASYKFNVIDGGLFNNEPIGLCRKSLETYHRGGITLKSDSKTCWGTCVLIDSASNSSVTIGPNEDEQYTLFRNLATVFSSLRNEASFKMDQLLSMLDENDVSQYIISPVPLRTDDSDAKMPPGRGKTATETLEYFGGFLHPLIRHHDFMLGRKNAQEFLRKTLVVEVDKVRDNPVFAGVEEYAEECGRKKTVPIIPLVGSANQECINPVWPKFDAQTLESVQRDMESKVGARMKVVTSAYARNMGLLSPVQFFLSPMRLKNAFIRLVINRVAAFAVVKVAAAVKRALKAFE